MTPSPSSTNTLECPRNSSTTFSPWRACRWRMPAWSGGTITKCKIRIYDWSNLAENKMATEIWKLFNFSVDACDLYVHLRLRRDRKTGVGNWAGSIESTYEFAPVKVQFDARFYFLRRCVNMSTQNWRVGKIHQALKITNTADCGPVMLLLSCVFLKIKWYFC